MNCKITEKIINCIGFWIIITIMGATVGCFIGFSICDTNSATTEDFRPLIKFQDSIIENFNSVYSYPNSVIKVKEDTIIVSAENEECSVNIVFDKNTNYIYTEKLDKVDPSGTVIASTLFCTIMGIMIAIFGTTVLLFLIETLVEYIYNKTHKSKLPYDNITNIPKL